MKYYTKFSNGEKAKTFDSMHEAMEYIAKIFRADADELGTWEVDGTDETHVWMTQDEADAAQDSSDIIACITELA